MPRDTSVLRTRDTSFVDAGERDGLYRIHVREGAGGLEQRFEYVVRGPDSPLRSWAEDGGACIAEVRDVSGVSYAQVIASTPLPLDSALESVSFESLRSGDRDGTLDWLWDRVDSTSGAPLRLGGGRPRAWGRPDDPRYFTILYVRPSSDTYKNRAS